MANAAPNPRELQSAWVVLRLAIRTAAKQYAPKLMERANTLSGQPVDPEQVAPLARHLDEELAMQSGADTPSPVLRLIKKTFQPNEAEKERRNLAKAFNAYLKVWQAQAPTP